MLVCLPFCQKDHDRAADLVKWIGELGGCKSHDCFLVVDVATPYNEVVKICDMAETCFKSVKVVPNEYHVSGWIAGSVSLFTAAAKEAAGQPFLFLEPDSTPLKAGWLDEIESAYKTCGKPFMGAFVTHTMPKRPSPYLEGVSVYPPNAYEIMRPLLTPSDSWVFSCAPMVMPQAVNTPLVSQLWGMAQNAPVFAEKNIPGSNVFCLAQIPQEAVLHHRVKDGSLIRLLRRHMGLVNIPKKLDVVFSFCMKDLSLATKNMQWLARLHPKKDRTLIIQPDGAVLPNHYQPIVLSARAAFETVSVHNIPRAPNPSWPSGPNFGFQRACMMMKNRGNPWIWLEADSVPVVHDWVEQLEVEYELGQKPFMGTIIGGMGHMNGVAVYPPDPVHYSPAIMTTKTAFDMAMFPQIVPNHVHKANHLIQHCRAFGQDKCHDCHGEPPKFDTPSSFDCVNPTTVLFHPDKTGNLIRWLNQKHNESLNPHSNIRQGFPVSQVLS